MADSAISFTASEICAYYGVRVSQLQQRAGEWRGPCPIHGGKRDSFAVEPHTGLWKCHSNCDRGGDIIALEQALTGVNFKTAMAEVFRVVGRPESSSGNHRRIVATYDYNDESGQLLYQAVRTDPKDFRQRRPDGNGGWTWNIKGVRLVLYRLPELLKRVTETLVICEGERDVASLETRGQLATCNPMGAGKWRAEYSEAIRGRSAVVVPDNDKPGRAHAAAVAADLLRVDCEVRIVEVPVGKDVSDWFAAGGTPEDLRRLASELPALTVETLGSWRARWELADEPQHQAGRAEASDDWPDPIPFQCRSTPALPADSLPGFLGDMVSATARATETPVEMAALLGLAMVAASVAKKVIVSPESGYIEPVNLYTAVGMESGNRKTAVLSSMTRPFVNWEEAESCRLKPEISRIASERKTMEMAIETLRKNAAKKPHDSGLIAEITEMESSLPEAPKAPRLWTQDITPERLGSLMAEQGERMALFSDEGGIFDTLAGRYNKGVPNLDLFLQAHAGAPVRVDRGFRPPVMLYRPALTLAPAPQPDVLATLSDKPGFRGRGLLARILYGLPLSPIGFRKLNACPCPAATEAAYNAGIERLLGLVPPMDEDDQWQPWRLTFDPKAYSSWKDFQRSIEILMREGNQLYGLKDWGSKLAGAAARIAGVLHCVTADPTTSARITLDTVERTLNLLVVIKDHTLAVFSLMERDKNAEDARKILEWIQKQGELSFTVRACFCAHQSRFGTVDGIRLPLSLLEQHYCIRPCPKAQVSHRPSEAYNVNPKLLGAS
jgi:hypothetical protein